MTSFAFIFGVIPLVVASGAGAEMRRSLGIAVFSGMLGVTLFGIFLTPVFFSVIQGLERDAAVLRPRPRAGSARPSLGGLVGLGIGFLLARAGRRRAVPGRSGSAAPAGVLAAPRRAGHSSEDPRSDGQRPSTARTHRAPPHARTPVRTERRA